MDIPATSGASLKQELWQKFGWPYGKDALKFRTGFLRLWILPAVPDHRSAQDMRKRLGHQLWQRTFTFSLIRNPWERYLSLFLWEKMVKNKGKYSPSLPLGLMRLLFKDWLIQKILQKSHYGTAKGMLLDENGNMLVDFVARYENREEDLAYIGQKINYPEFGKILHENKRIPEKFHYSEYYDSEMRDVVAEVAKWEIEKFNYSFDRK